MKAEAGIDGTPSSPHPLATSRRGLLARGGLGAAAVLGAADPDPAGVAAGLADDARHLNMMLIDAEEMIAALGFAVEAFLEAAVDAQGDFPCARLFVVAAEKLDRDVRKLEEWQEEARMLSHNVAAVLSPAHRAVG